MTQKMRQWQNDPTTAMQKESTRKDEGNNLDSTDPSD
jgi:hypothetical protein